MYANISQIQHHCEEQRLNKKTSFSTTNVRSQGFSQLARIPQGLVHIRPPDRGKPPAFGTLKMQTAYLGAMRLRFPHVSYDLQRLIDKFNAYIGANLKAQYG